MSPGVKLTSLIKVRHRLYANMVDDNLNYHLIIPTKASGLIDCSYSLAHFLQLFDVYIQYILYVFIGKQPRATTTTKKRSKGEEIKIIL
jgi:hypothetical protein